MEPARWPFAMVTVETRTFPALVVGWQRLRDANGYETWHARCLWWADSKAHEGLVPAQRVSKVGG